MIVNIVPIDILNKTADKVVLTANKYDLEGITCNFEYSLIDSDFNTVTSGMITFGQDVISVWGTEDSTIVETLLANLGLTAI